jgi:hypothetical protein
MTDRFEQEFYKSPWHRVLPVGPHGIAPYVRPAGEQGARAGALPWRRLAAIVGPALRIAARTAGQVPPDAGTLRPLRKAA